jgi:hypothetical protein
VPDVHGPWSTGGFTQGPYYRDRGYTEPSGVQGAPAATPGAGDLGLTAVGLTLSLGLGRAHVRGAAYERTGTAWTYATPANTNATLNRIDRVVLRRDLAAQTVAPAVLQGTAAATPAPPALTQAEDGVWEIGLFQVTVPPASGTTLTIVDERTWIDPATAQVVAAHGYVEGTAVQALTTGAATVILLETAVRLRGFTYDAAGGRLICVTPGVYLCSGKVAFSSNGTGRRLVNLYKNATQVVQSENGVTAAGANTQPTASATVPIVLAAGDALTLVGYQDSGVTLNALRANSFLQATYIGPS